MRASEILRRYANGERNFQRENLRGQSFKGQDLSGADFSEADLRGTNFTSANLKGANFTKAKTGVLQECLVVQLGTSFLLTFVVNFLAALVNGSLIGAVFSEEIKKSAGYLPGILVLLIVTAVFFAIAHQGLTTRALVTVAIAFATAVAVGLIGGGVGTLVGNSAIVVAVAGAVASAGAFAVTFAVAIAVTFAVAITGAVAGAVVFAFASTISNIPRTVAISVAFVVTLLSSYITWRTFKGDDKFALVRTFGVAFGAMGGTRFYKADLTRANFSKVTLKSSNFREAVITHVCWNDAKQLDRARLGDSILANPAVRDLLTTRNGYTKSYIEANLRGANLNGVNLEGANLKWADLSEATMHQATLKDANLREVLAIGTDFTEAYLTGACLETWNIDHTTKLENVDCQYVFLLENPNAFGNRERRPHSSDQVFAPGDFEKLYQKMINVVQILLRNGINREAFAEAFQKLMDDHPEVTFDSIQSIEKKGEDVLLTLEVPEAANKAKIEQSFLQPYEARVRQLEAKVEELQTLRATDLKDIALAIAKSPIQNINQLALGEGKTVNENTDQSQTISVGGNFSIDATNSVVNLRDISGSVTNAIHQLPNDSKPGQPNFKELLTQLQQAIETDTDLPDVDKADLLEQVQALTEAKQTEEPAKKEGLARKAKKIFEATLKGLPDTAKIVEACSKILPFILKALGLPV